MAIREKALAVREAEVVMKEKLIIYKSEEGNNQATLERC